MARGWHYTKLSLSSDCSMSHHRVARGKKQRIDLSDHNYFIISCMCMYVWSYI